MGIIMFYGQSPREMRQFYFDAWEQFRARAPLDSFMQQLADVILAHPEYHRFLEDKANIDKEFLPDLGQPNPFLHMGLHLAIRDQIKLNRPQGIAEVYQALLQTHQDAMHVEHLLIDVLAESLWQSQRDMTMPDEDQYLINLKALLK